jgi:hypothetical protein
VPVISASHGAGIIHALLHDRPLAAAAHDECVQIKLTTVGNGVVIDARGEAAGAHQRVAIEVGFVGEGAEFVWGSPRLPSASPADMDSEFVRAGIDSALQSAQHRGGDAGGVPVHAHHASERLEPERIAETRQEL